MNIVHVFPGRTVWPGRRREWFIRLVSPNGETLATSEAYVSRWGAKRAARRNFAGLPIIEVKE